MRTFKYLVESKYQVVETSDEEITAGLKDVFKKAALFFTGVAMLTQTAMGMQLNSSKLKNYETGMQKALHDLNNDESANEGNKYDFKIVEKKNGNLQHVDFIVLMNGKEAGKVQFSGAPKTQHGDYSKFATKISPDAENDKWVNYVMDSQVKLLTDLIHGK